MNADMDIQPTTTTTRRIRVAKRRSKVLAVPTKDLLQKEDPLDQGNKKVPRLAKRKHLILQGKSSSTTCVSDFKRKTSAGDLLCREVLGDVTNQLKRKSPEDEIPPARTASSIPSSTTEAAEPSPSQMRVRRLSSSISLPDVLATLIREGEKAVADKENLLLADFEPATSSTTSCTPPPLRRNRSLQRLDLSAESSEKKDKGKDKVRDEETTAESIMVVDKQPLIPLDLLCEETSLLDEPAYWECSECTFHNDISFLVCNVCLGIRQDNVKVKLPNKDTEEELGERWVLVRSHRYALTGADPTTRSKATSSQVDDEEEEEGGKGKEKIEDTLLAIHPAQEPPEDGYCWFDALPVEIMFKIFGHLKANTLWRLSSVSRYWREICSDPCLWVPLQLAIRVEKTTKPAPAPLYTRNWPAWRLAANQNWGTTTTTRHIVVDSNEIEVGELDWESDEAKRNDLSWFDMYRTNTSANVVQPKNAPKELLSSNKDPYWQWRCGINEDNQVEGRLLFNIGRLESEILRGTTVSPCLGFLFRLADEAFSDVSFDRFNKHCVPSWFAHGSRKRTITPLQQPKALAKVKLFSYQLESLSWMYEIERRSDQRLGWQFSKLAEWRSLTKRLWVDHKQKTLRSFDEAPSDHIATLRTRGGILSDEMGLGKTLTVLSLILTNPQTPESLASAPAVDEAHFDTKATLVFCPNHLAKQWFDEIETKTHPKLKVLMLTTIADFKMTNYCDIMNADVVVASFSLFRNNNYLRKGYSAKKFVQAARLRNILNAVRRMKAKIAAGDTSKKDPLLEKAPLLEQFRWHRVIVDEGHEILADRYFLKSLKGIEAKYRWYVTGTPLPHSIDSLRGAARFLQAEISSGEKIFARTVQGTGRNQFSLPANKFFDWKLAEVLMQNIYCRHTKLSVGTEYAVPGLKEKVMLLEMSETERAMYLIAKTHGDKLHMRQLCCHPQISNEDCSVLGDRRRSMLEIKDKMIAHKLGQVKDQKKRIKEKKGAIQLLAEKLAELEEKIDEQKEERRQELKKDPSLTWAYVQEIDEKFSKRKKNIKDTISRHKIEIEGIRTGPIKTLRHEMDFFKSIKDDKKEDEKKKQEEDGSSAMKVDEKEDEDAMEEEEEEENEKMVDEGEDDEGSQNDEKTLKKLIESYGCKMANLIHYIRKICKKPETRIIIFSQWDKMLHRVGETLEESGIANVFCQGNVIRRRKAINAFKAENSGVRVIMLSLQNSASGTNLTEATHVIMLDPVAGTREAARATEGQALGRAHRLGQTKELTVVRLIMQNTIEHKLYLRNYASLVEAQSH